MNVTLAMVMSLDGKTTKWYDPHIYTWTSKEDQKHFFSLIEKYSAIVMGRKTYEAAKTIIRHVPGKTRIVLTSKLTKYASETIPNQLEFMNNSPQVILSTLEKKGYSEVLLVGGETTNSAFLKAQLVHTVLLTVEPRIFGSGNALVSPHKIDTDLELLEMKQLNKKGALLLRYNVITNRKFPTS